MTADICLAPDELTALRQALDIIDARAVVLAQQADAADHARRISEAAAIVRYLVNRADARQHVH